MNECEKRGFSCPPALKCVKQNHNYECGCDPGFKAMGGGNARTCKGESTIKLILTRILCHFRGCSENPWHLAHLLTDDVFIAMNECEKKGLKCPPALKCVKQKQSYECGCNPGFKIVGGGNRRTCKGTIISLILSWWLLTKYEMLRVGLRPIILSSWEIKHVWKNACFLYFSSFYLNELISMHKSISQSKLP